MKMSKIFAGMSALAMAVTASAVTVSANEAFMTTPQMSWSKTAPTDAVKGVVKFGGLGDDGSAKTAYGACDINQWVTGDKYNGMWCQYTLCSNDLSSITISFDVEIGDDTEWEYHHPDGADGKNDYEILRIFAGDAMISEKISWDEAVGGVDVDTHKQNDLVKGADGAKTGTFSYTVTGADIQKALDTPSSEGDGNCAQLAQAEDGTEMYTLGFNVQTGHFYNGKLTIKINGDTLAEVDENNGAVNPNAATTSEGGDSTGGDSTTDGTTSTSDGTSTDTTSSGSDTTSSGSDTTSSSGGSTTSSSTTSSSTSSTSSSTTSKSSTTTTTTAKTTGTAGASGSASKADGSEAASDNTANAESGSAASVALGIAALAGAALVVSKRR